MSPGESGGTGYAVGTAPQPTRDSPSPDYGLRGVLPWRAGTHRARSRVRRGLWGALSELNFFC